MSANVPLSIRIAAIFDNKGLKQADKGISKLSSSAKKLGVALGLALSTRAIVNFGKASVRASLQAQAEQDRLNQLLTVGVGATASQIAALNDQAEALEKLGVVTAGNITQTQSQLATFNLQTSTIEKLTPAILDYVTAEKGATASTEQFKQMTNGLAQALNGNFSSLTRVGFVIDENTKKQIKSGNESERAQAIVDVLNSTYKDFNKNLRDTPAGQMQVLANAAEDAQTIIGTGLIDSLMILSGDTSVEDLAETMQDVATNTSKAITEVAKLGRSIGTFFSGGFGAIDQFSNDITDLLDRLTFNTDRIGRRGVGQARRSFMGGSGGAGGNIETPQERALRIKRENDQKRLAANLLANENKRLKSEKARVALAKAQLALGRASKTLDLELISIEAALKGEISATDRLSLNLQKALLEENDSRATQLAKQLEDAVRRQNELSLALLATPEAPNPYRNWKPPTFVGPVMIEGGTAPQNPLKIPYGEPVPNFNVPSYMTSDSGMGGLQANDYLRLGALGGNVADTIVNVEVNLDGATVGGAIRDTSINDSLSGSFNSVNRAGRFSPRVL
jgi:hypothetical protein